MSLDESTHRDRSAAGVLLIIGLVAGVMLLMLGAGGFFYYRTTAQGLNNARQQAVLQAELAAAKERDGEQFDPIHANLSKVSLKEADRFDGKRMRVSFKLFDNYDLHDGHEVYEADGPDDGAERSVWVPKGRKVPMSGAAVGVMRVLRHEASVGEDGTEFPAFVELRFVLDR